MQNGFTLTTIYLLDPANRQLTELSVGSGSTTPSWQHTNVYAGGQMVATYDNVGLHFHVSDWLGTRREQLDYAGNLEESCSSSPYGDQLQCAHTSLTTAEDATEHHFTGKERDTESGLDYFGARYYGSSMGRWMSPDWSAKAEPVPYAKLDNPQSLNFYAYVGNNPLSNFDPNGHADIAAECKGQSTCNKTLVQAVNIVRQDKNGNSYVQSTLKVTTNFILTTDSNGKVSASASSTVENAGGTKYTNAQLATMSKDIGTMQQAAVLMGFGQNTTQLVTSIGAAETSLGGDQGPSGKMNPADNPMQLVRGAKPGDLNHNVEGAMGVLDWAGTAKGNNFNPWQTYWNYSDKGSATMSNGDGSYKSITETQK